MKYTTNDKGNVHYWVNGKLHREDGPAVEYANGDQEWHINGELHRIDGPAIKDYTGKYWFFNGKYHRNDGPAIEYTNGNMHWYNHGKRHREDGPAMENPSIGGKGWYLNDKYYTEQQFNEIKDFPMLW